VRRERIPIIRRRQVELRRQSLPRDGSSEREREYGLTLWVISEAVGPGGPRTDVRKKTANIENGDKLKC